MKNYKLAFFFKSLVLGLVLINQFAAAAFAQTYQSELLSHTIPTKIHPGQTVSVYVSLKNTGTAPWSGQESIYLGVKNPAGSMLWGINQAGFYSSDLIQPGKQKNFSFQITAPSTPGEYPLQFQMYREGTGWFGETIPSNTMVKVSKTEVYYLHTDHLDTPRLVTDQSNKIVWQNLPLGEPFGVTPVEEDPDGDGTPFTLNLRFPGQYFDKESNLHYNYYRDYNPTLGRYVQSDPIGLEGGINTYTYVNGNPISYTDPQGLLADKLLIGGFIVGGIFAYQWYVNQPKPGSGSGGDGLFGEPFSPSTFPGGYPSSHGGPMSRPDPMEMADQGRNWATEQAKLQAQVNCTEPCDELEEMLKDAKRARDMKRVKDIEQAQKYLHCRNVEKRKNHY